MLIDTQINSFLVPLKLWHQGCPDLPDLPPPSLPARDALDIERRAQKGVNLRKESQRYTLCCQRIQSIVLELARGHNLLPPSFIYPARKTSGQDLPVARAYLALIEVIKKSLHSNKAAPYLRVSALFFPPEDAIIHSRIFDSMCRLPNLEQLFQKAAEIALLPGSSFIITPDECKRAFESRCEVLKTAASEEYGVVDVVDLVTLC